MRATPFVWTTLAASLLSLGCGDDGTAAPPTSSTGATSGGNPDASVTYWEHVKPIFDAKCSTCHVEGGPAPFATTTYAEVEKYKDIIKPYVVEREMPPWPAAEGCADYIGDRSLTDEQIELVAKWVDEGGVEGDPAKEGKPLSTNYTGLSRVDLTIDMPVDYTPQIEPDDYRCFPMAWPESTTKYVTGFRAKPGTAAIVHHVIAFVATPAQAGEVEALDEAEPGPGYTCYGGPGLQASWLGGWAPGNLGSDYPLDTGLRVEPGSTVILQVHYNTLTAAPQPDRSAVELRLDDSVKTEAWVQPWANPQWVAGNGMDIPAGSMGVTHSFTVDPTPYISDGQPFAIWSAGLHMHTKGRSAKLAIQRASGGEECLLEIPKWNFHWQGAYALTQPKSFQPGDKLHLECTWDNPTPNDVKWGEGTQDEMCLGTLYLTR